MKIRSLLPILALCAACLTCPAQTARLYTPENGLPNSQINIICQDRSGIIWIGTEGGLVRFDGLDFEVFRHDRENPNSIISDSVHAFLEDSMGSRWIGTASGLALFDSDYNTFRRFDLQDPRRLESNMFIGQLLEIPGRTDGARLLVATGGYGIFVIDAASRTLLDDPRERLRSQLTSEFIGRMFLDADRHLWISAEGPEQTIILDADTLTPAEGIAFEPGLAGRWPQVHVESFAEDPVSRNLLISTSADGLLVYESATRTLRRARGQRAARLKASALLFDSQSETADTRSFLVGNGEGGLLRFDIRSEELSPGSLPSIRQDVSTWKANTFAEDNQGNVWLGLYQTGVLVAPKSMFGFGWQGFSSRGIPGENSACVMSLYDDGTRLWAGTDGAGLFCVEGSRIRNYSRDNSGLDNNAIMAVTGDKRGSLWIGTYQGGLFYMDPRGDIRTFPQGAELGSERIRTLTYDPERDLLYVGTYGAGFSIVDARTRRFAGRIEQDDIRWVSALHLDSLGQLWIGTYNGPQRYDPDSQELVPFSLLPDGEPRIYAICSEPDGSMWFGTGEGVFHSEAGGGAIRHYTERDGLANNVVRDILRAANGDLWISTANGLSCLRPQGGEITSYHASDGLQGNEFRSGAACVSPASGRLWFGGTSGASAVSPALMGSNVHKVPQVALSRLTLLDREVVYDPALGGSNLIDKHIASATRISLPPHADLFSLEFSVPEFTNPERIVYAYRLRGYDTDWKTTSARLHMATYTNVPPGRYRFEVKAYFEGAPEDYTEHGVDVLVAAPWYRSAGAYVFYFILLAGLVFLLGNVFRQKRKRAQDRADAELKELRLGLFTNLTHEIRTPLNLVMGPLGMMREAEQDPARKDTYNLMYRNCLRINRIVNQVMDLRKIDAGQMPMHFRETELIYFIRDIMQSFGNLAQTRRIRFSLESAHDEETVWIDQGNFDKVIYNILSNAFKHTPEGGCIRIGVSAPTPNTGELRADIQEWVKVRIFNSGSRVDEAWIGRIFDRFVQVNPYDALSGSGVGLNLSKMLIDLHHGRISVENVEDGVEFSVLIPAGKEHLTPEELSETTRHKDLYVKQRSDNHEDLTFAAAGSRQERTVRAKKTLVVVEDDEDTREYLKTLLHERYNVTACADAAEAWPVLTAHVPDAVITDLIMPGMSGSELCARIRQHPDTNHVPVIILTGESSEQQEQLANENGADKFLSKPVSVELLLSSISQVISAREAVKDKFGVSLDYDYSGIKMGSADEKLMHRIVESISAHLDDPDYGVATLCEDAGISRVHLNRKLKAFGKESPGALIKTFRMKQAAHLLAESQVNVSEVAYRVGFASHSYFSSSFKEYFGMTPREFVARWQENPEDEIMKKMLE